MNNTETKKGSIMK